MSYYNGKKVLSVVAVEYLNPNGTIKLTENGSFDVRAYKKAVVSVFPSGTIQKIEDEGVAQGAGAFPSTILPKGLINYVGGMSQKVNNLVKNGNFASVSDWLLNGPTSYTTSNNVGTFTHLYNGSFRQIFNIVSGHKYLYTASFKKHAVGSADGKVLISYYNQNSEVVRKTLVETQITDDWQSRYVIFSGIETEEARFYHYNISATIQNGTIDFKNIALVDLTNDYGAGNEPTTTSDPRISQLIALLKKYPQYNEGSIVNAKVTNLLSTDGTNETDYPIPAEVQALDGYGMGIDDTLFNYIDFERKKFVKKVGKEQLSNLNFIKAVFSGNAYYYAKADDNYASYSDAVIIGVCSAYGVSDTYSLPVDGNITFSSGYVGGGYTIVIRDDSISSVNELIQKLLNKGEIVFKLKTPTETDISEYLDRNFPNENLIDLYADGKVYFENENDMEVPYSLTYQERIN